LVKRIFQIKGIGTQWEREREKEREKSNESEEGQKNGAEANI
jgi:hypothetical protein